MRTDTRPRKRLSREAGRAVSGSRSPFPAPPPRSHPGTHQQLLRERPGRTPRCPTAPGRPPRRRTRRSLPAKQARPGPAQWGSASPQAARGSGTKTKGNPSGTRPSRRRRRRHGAPARPREGKSNPIQSSPVQSRPVPLTSARRRSPPPPARPGDAAALPALPARRRK